MKNRFTGRLGYSQSLFPLAGFSWSPDSAFAFTLNSPTTGQIIGVFWIKCRVQSSLWNEIKIIKMRKLTKQRKNGLKRKCLTALPHFELTVYVNPKRGNSNLIKGSRLAQKLCM